MRRRLGAGVVVVVAFAWAGWSAAAQEVAVEEVTVIPGDGTILGSIGDVDILPDGRVVVLDGQASTVYVYAQDGKLLQSLGGEGEGPGEIKLSREVEVGPGGEIVVADAGNVRLTRWSSDGELLGSRRLDALLGPGVRWPHELQWTQAGHFLKATEFQPGTPVSFFRLPNDLQGPGELMVEVTQGEVGETCMFCPVAVDDRGMVLGARGDTLYEVAEMTGSLGQGRVWRRSDLPAVPRSQEELDRLSRDMRRIAAAEGGGPGTSFPPYKTRFGPHGLGVDGGGRLWTAPRVADGAPGFFDVFDVDGKYLASVKLDVPVQGFRIRGRWLVVGSESDLGEPVVRVYRVTG